MRESRGKENQVENFSIVSIKIMGLTRMIAVKMMKLSKFRKYFGTEGTEFSDGLNVESNLGEQSRIVLNWGLNQLVSLTKNGEEQRMSG